MGNLLYIICFYTQLEYNNDFSFYFRILIYVYFLSISFILGKSYGRLVDWMDASGKELSLWQNMLDRPNFWVEGSVVLRSSLEGIRALP